MNTTNRLARLYHAAVRALGLHPARRDGEANARSTAEMLEFIRRDHYNVGRRHTDTVPDLRAARKDREPINDLLTERSTSGQL